MFCMNCGKQLENGSKFCPHCGTKLNQTQEIVEPEAIEPVVSVEQSEQEVQAPDEGSAKDVLEATVPDSTGSSDATKNSTAAPPAQEPIITGKKKKSGVLIGVGAAAVAVVVAVVLLISGVFSSPQVKLGKAVVKSAKAYETVYNDLGGMDVAALAASEKISQNLNLTIGELDGDSTYDGIGVRISNDVDLPGQKMDFTMTPFYESADIATIQLGLNGTKLYVGSPELTNGLFYGVDTATLGQDIANLTDDDYLEGLSFNVYDLIKAMKELQDIDAVKNNVKAANKALIESLEITKQEQKTIKVNNNDVKATKYHVILTTDALDAYLDALEESIDTKQMVDNLDAIIETLGLPEEAQDELKMEYEDFDLDYLFDELHDVVDELEDIEVDAYVGNGYLVAVEYEGDFEDARITLRAQLGGGKNYVDDITISFKVKGEGELVLTSTGNHCGEGGIFTDETTITLKENGGSKETVFASENEYNKKDLSYKGEMKFGEEESISFKGTWKMDKSSLDVQLNKLKVKSWGETVFEGAVGYTIGSYKSSGANVSDVTMLLTMTEDELMEMAEDLYDNFVSMIEDLDLDLYLPDDPFGYEAEYEPEYGYDDAWAGSDDYWYGYDIGYDDGYDDGWYETDYDTSDGYIYDGDTFSGYLDGYSTGYDDGYYGYEYLESYGT